MTWLWKVFFSALWGEVFKPLIRYALSTIGGKVVEHAKWAVQYVLDHPEVIGDDDKRRIAREILQSRLESDGKAISDSLANLFIELIVQWEKKRWT